MLVTPDTARKKEVRTRQRASTSCTECRRRKQKCNQAKDRPCNNCARRYPPVPCTYEVFRRTSKYKERVIELELSVNVAQPQSEHSDSNNTKAASSGILALRRHSSSVSKLAVSQVRPHRSQDVSRSLSRPSSPTGILHEGPEEDDISPVSDDPPSDEDECHDLSPMFRQRKFQSLPESFQRAFYGVTKATTLGDGGGDTFRCLPVEPSKRNYEFIQFFVHKLAPYMSSVDGVASPSSQFNQQWVSFMIQSPILVYIGILSSTYFYATARGIDVDKSVEVVTARVNIIHMINDYIKVNASKGASDEVIATVMSLAYNELIYADERSTIAHMKGLADMIQTRGGLKNIHYVHLQRLLVRTDFNVALTFECELLLQDDERNRPLKVIDTYPLELDSPFLQSRMHFIHSAEALGISEETANLLDEMRLLTTSVIQIAKFGETPDSLTKFNTASELVRRRLFSPNPPKVGNVEEITTDHIYQTCLSAAQIFSTAILTRTPFSQSCTPSLLQTLWSTMWRVPLPRWKQIPGIFLWILVVVNPFARDKPEARFLKGLTPATTMAIGLVDWDVSEKMLLGCLVVQRWLRGVREVEREEGDLSCLVPRSVAPERGIPAWALNG